MDWEMDYEMPDEEYESIISLPPEARYKHSIEKLVDWEVLWSLGAEDGWVVAADDDGIECLPVWPHPRFAAIRATGKWSGTSPQPIELDEWMRKWLPGISKDKKRVNVFPTPSDIGVFLYASEMHGDILAEIHRYLDSAEPEEE